MDCAAALATAKRHAEDRVGAEPGLVRSSVELDQRLVDGDLVRGDHSADRLGDLGPDGLHGLQNAFALEALPVAVAKLDRFVGARRRAGRDCGPALRAVGERHVDLNGRISAAVEYFAGGDFSNFGHDHFLLGGGYTLRILSMFVVPGDTDRGSGRDDDGVALLGKALFERRLARKGAHLVHGADRGNFDRMDAPGQRQSSCRLQRSRPC